MSKQLWLLLQTALLWTAAFLLALAILAQDGAL